MYEVYGIVIDEQGYMVTAVVLNEDGIPQDHILKENEQIIEKDVQIAWSMNKAKWNFDTEEWEETEPLEPPPIDNCPPKTLEQRLEEAEQKLAESEEEKKLLKAQVEANASSYEFLESCVMEMAGKVYA